MWLMQCLIRVWIKKEQIDYYSRTGCGQKLPFSNTCPVKGIFLGPQVILPE